MFDFICLQAPVSTVAPTGDGNGRQSATILTNT